MRASRGTEPAVTKTAPARDSIDATLDRIRGEYREMPGLQLTFEQMCRLWMLDRQTCRTVIERLLESRFLKPTRDGQYVRGDFRQSTPRRRHQEV